MEIYLLGILKTVVCNLKPWHHMPLSNALQKSDTKAGTKWEVMLAAQHVTNMVDVGYAMSPTTCLAIDSSIRWEPMLAENFNLHTTKVEAHFNSKRLLFLTPR